MVKVSASDGGATKLMASKESFSWVVELNMESKMGIGQWRRWSGRNYLNLREMGRCRAAQEGYTASALRVLLLWHPASLVALPPALLALLTSLGNVEKKCPEKGDLIKKTSLFSPCLLHKAGALELWASLGCFLGMLNRKDTKKVVLW